MTCLRNNFEIEIRWENGDTRTIPMYATPRQATKALTALSFALNMSKVKELVMWVCYERNNSRVQWSRIGYGRVEKAQPAKLKKSA